MGWQGLAMQVPPEWNLVAYGGDSKAGSLRLDNGEFVTHGILGVDIRWMPVKGSVTDGDIEKRLTQYLESITKSAKRQKIAAVTQVKVVQDSRHPERTGLRTFTWKADRKAVGRIWHCGECGRVIIAQVLGGPRDDFHSLAADVLQTLDCHPAEPGWRLWSLYDLQTQLPADYALSGKPQLMNIYVQLPSARGTSLDIVTVEQWGVANVQLRGAYLDQWFREKNKAAEGSLRYDAQEGKSHGHPVLALNGRRTGLVYWLSQALPQILRLQRPATHFAARIWECPEGNKIFLVQSFSRRPQPALVDEIVERTLCHA